MTPSLTILILVSLGTDFACAARKHLDSRARHAVGQHGRRSNGPSFANDDRTRTQAVAIYSTTTPTPNASSGAENLTFKPKRMQVVAMRTYSVFLEHASRLMLVVENRAVRFDEKRSLAAYLAVLSTLAIVSVVVLCMFVRKAMLISNNEYETESDTDLGSGFEDSETGSDIKTIVARLSQTLRMRTVSDSTGSSCGTGVHERHFCLWWNTDSHTWSSTRLGWWESQLHYKQRGPALDGLFLKDISEAIVTDSTEIDGEPGVRITHDSQRPSRAYNLQLFFATQELATKYAEDLMWMVKAVKKAHAKETEYTPVALGRAATAPASASVRVGFSSFIPQRLARVMSNRNS